MQNISDNPGFTNWEIDFINENYSRYGVLYGIDSFSLKGLNILDQDLFPGTSIKEELLELQEGYSFEKEIRNIPASGQGFISVFVKGSPVFVDGQFNGGILIIEDIKTVKQTEQDDIQLADQVSKIAGRFYDIFLIVDTERRIKYLSGNDYEKLVSSDESVIDKPLSRIFTKEVLNNLLPAVASAIEKRSIEELTLEIKTTEEKLGYNCRIFPYQSKHRQIKFVYLFFENVTDIQKEVSRLRNEFTRLDAYATAAQNIPQPILTTGIEGDVKFFNGAAEKCFNATPESYGKFVGEIIGQFDKPYFNKIKGELDKSGYWKTTLSVFKENKQKETYEVRFTVTENSMHPIIVTCTDITDQTAFESKLKSSEERCFRLLPGALPK